MKGAVRAPTATVGVVEHGNSAFLVTLASDGQLLDRRHVDLTANLPTHPHHHEGSWAVGRYLNTPGARRLSLEEAVALVERVQHAAEAGARAVLAALAASVPLPIGRITLRAWPVLPPTIAERIADNRAQTYADTAMYRAIIAAASAARGWTVHWYDRDTVHDDAARATGLADIRAHLMELGRALGPPWKAEHKLAAAAVLALGPSDSA